MDGRHIFALHAKALNANVNMLKNGAECARLGLFYVFKALPMLCCQIFVDGSNRLSKHALELQHVVELLQITKD